MAWIRAVGNRGNEHAKCPFGHECVEPLEQLGLVDSHLLSSVAIPPPKHRDGNDDYRGRERAIPAEIAEVE